MKCIVLLLSFAATASALVPLLDGGKSMPKCYDGWMNDQIAKQASTAISNAISAGYKNIEVQFPPVPNVDEVRLIFWRSFLICHLDLWIQCAWCFYFNKLMFFYLG